MVRGLARDRLTIPLITNFVIAHFDAAGGLGLQMGKVIQVIAIVLVITRDSRAQRIARA